MQLLTAQLPPHHRIVLASDLHKGSLAHHRKGWSDLIKRVKDEDDLYIALGGDQQEAILVDDKRFSYHVHDARKVPLRVAEELADELSPVAKKILFVLTGNHELHLQKYGDLTETMCNRIGVPYGHYSTKLAVSSMSSKNPKLHYKLLYTHGRLRVSSSADDPVRRLSNMKLSIKRKLQHLAGDCAIMATGHCHLLMHIAPEFELYLTDDGQQISARYTHGVQVGDYIDPNLRWYCSTGSFLKSFVTGAITYSEAAMYQPNQLGYIEIAVTNGKIKDIKDIHIGHDDIIEEITDEHREERATETA